MSGTCVQHWVSEHAKATPDAIAIVACNRTITYQELNRRANQVAHLLRSRGVKEGGSVALCMPRSIELAVAALGILKAGCSYLPLDPSYPSNRIATILESSATPLVITQKCLRSAVQEGACQVVMLELDALDSLGYPQTDPGTNTGPGDIAYTIFTSGSTGQPKGVQVSHANLNNLISWHQKAFGVTATDRATLHASPGFDASVWELWPYLAAGASMYVVDDDIRSSPQSLRDWIIANGITISYIPTAVAECMVGLSWPPETRLRYLLTGADTLRRRPPKTLPFSFVNNYGPTECTVVATSGVVSPEENAQELPSIGRPIVGVEVYIVDELMRPVAAGDVGELLIGGAGVARGYLNAPELTAQKFIPDLFSNRPGARLYRTGDLVRALPNGEIAFLGRIDDQLKIMGYRIEPREIISVLERCPGIRQSAVTDYVDQSGSRRLVAYLVAEDGTRPRPSEIRAFLANYLPDYMLPATFIALPALPMSAHGKLNRAALPPPTPDNILDEDTFESPASEVEQQLASFLSTLMNVERVGRDDNFFMLGGHSLMGAQLIAKVRQTFGVDLSLRTLFEAPTVREMSAEIEKLIQDKIAAMSDEEALRLLAS